MAELPKRSGRITRIGVLFLLLVLGLTALIVELVRPPEVIIIIQKPPAMEPVVKPKAAPRPRRVEKKPMPVGELTAWWEAWDNCRGNHCID